MRRYFLNTGWQNGARQNERYTKNLEFKRTDNKTNRNCAYFGRKRKRSYGSDTHRKTGLCRRRT